MKILRFNEAYNPKNEPNLIKKALFVTNLGSGHYQLCGTINSEEIEKAKVVENSNFKNFSFVKAESLKEVDPYEDCDNIVWLNNRGNLMVIESSETYAYVSTNKFDEYYNLLDKYSDYKLEMLPYFIKDSMGEFVIDFFDRLIENAPYKNCWKDIGIYSVINYIKDCTVYGAYNKLKEILIKGNHGYKFGKYFDHISDEDKDKADSMINMGFMD